MEKQSLHKYAGRWRVAGPCVAILLGFLASRSLLPIYTDSAPDAKLKSRPHSVGIQPKNLFPEIMKFEKAWFKVLDSETSSEVAGLEVSVVSAHDSIDARAVLVRDGGFELDGGFKEDDSLKVSAPGYFRLVLPFERLSALRQSLFLLPARAITVKAINASSGSPIPGALVTSNRPGREELSIKTDEGGLALLLDVSVNLVQARSGGLLYEVPVIVRAPGFLPTRAAAKPGVEAPVCVVALDPELMLDLIVVDAVTGQGVPNVGVVYQFNHGGLSRTNRFENVQLTGPTGTIQLLSSLPCQLM